METKIYKMAWYALFLAALFIMPGGIRILAADVSVESAKNAIVEIQVGLGDYNGTFYPVKSASGFVVCNQSNGAYIVTTNHTVTVSEKEKAKITKKNKLDASSGLTTQIRVFIESDVYEEAEIRASSVQDDFCVLLVEDVLQKKISLHLSDETELAAGDSIYLLGYSSDAEENGIYSEDKVEISGGSVEENTDSSKKGYIQHTAGLSRSQSGGPVLNGDGYLVGMCNLSMQDKDSGKNYALSIGKIKEILDNYGVNYESQEKDTAVSALKETYNRCKEKVESDDYKNDNKDEVESLISETEQLLSQESYRLSDICQLQKKMESAENNLAAKTSKIVIIKYVLLGVLILFVMWAVYKGLLYRKTKHGLSNDNKPAQNIPLQNKPVQNVSENKPVQNKPVWKQPNVWTGMNGNNGVSRGNTGAVPQLRVRAVLINKITGEIHEIKKNQFLIGKTPDNDCSLQSSVVSRKHAVIRCRPGGFYIEDLGSTNGTFVNGNKIPRGEVKLCTQDRIIFADVETEFVLEEVR